MFFFCIHLSSGGRTWKSSFIVSRWILHQVRYCNPFYLQNPFAYPGSIEPEDPCYHTFHATVAELDPAPKKPLLKGITEQAGRVANFEETFPMETNNTKEKILIFHNMSIYLLNFINLKKKIPQVSPTFPYACN